MPEVIVPPFPGVTSAMGLLFVDPLDDFSQSYVRRQADVDLADVARVLGGMGTAILSTSHGVVTSRTAEREGIGGEVICFVW